MYKLLKTLIFILPVVFIVYLFSLEESNNLEFYIMSIGFLVFSYLTIWYLMVLFMRIRILYFTTVRNKGLSDFKVRYIDNFYGGFASFSIENLTNKETKYGFINKKGKIVIQPIYDSVERFHNGQTMVSKSGNEICLNRPIKEL